MRQRQSLANTQQQLARPELGMRALIDDEIMVLNGTRVTVHVQLHPTARGRIRAVVIFERPKMSSLAFSTDWIRTRKFRNWIGKPAEAATGASLEVLQQNPECPEVVLFLSLRGKRGKMRIEWSAYAATLEAFLDFPELDRQADDPDDDEQSEIRQESC